MHVGQKCLRITLYFGSLQVCILLKYLQYTFRKLFTCSDYKKSKFNIFIKYEHLYHVMRSQIVTDIMFFHKRSNRMVLTDFQLEIQI